VKLETGTAGSKTTSNEDIFLDVLFLLKLLVDEDRVCMIGSNGGKKMDGK
jgi:hypothetical protein